MQNLTEKYGAGCFVLIVILGEKGNKRKVVLCQIFTQT
jgi:hypothetical protein